MDNKIVRCQKMIYGSRGERHQCARNSIDGEFCRQHTSKFIAAQRKKQIINFEEKIKRQMAPFVELDNIRKIKVAAEKWVDFQDRSGILAITVADIRAVAKKILEGKGPND